MNDLFNNRNIIGLILRELPAKDLVKMRRMNRGYKAFVDTGCQDKFYIPRLDPIPERYFHENFDKSKFVKYVNDYLDNPDLNHTWIKKRIIFFNTFAYVLSNLENLYKYNNGHIFQSYLSTVISKICNEFATNKKFYQLELFRDLIKRYHRIYRKICIHNPGDYFVYFDSDISFIYGGVDTEDILRLRLVCKFFHKKFKKLNFKKSQKTKIETPKKYNLRINNTYINNNYIRFNAIIDSIDNAYHYRKCNQLADILNIFISYFNSLDQVILRTVYNKIQNLVNNKYVATKILYYVSAEFIRHIIEAKLHI